MVVVTGMFFFYNAAPPNDRAWQEAPGYYLHTESENFPGIFSNHQHSRVQLRFRGEGAIVLRGNLRSVYMCVCNSMGRCNFEDSARFRTTFGWREALERSVIGFKSRKPARNAVTVGWAVFSQDTVHEREGFLVGRIR